MTKNKDMAITLEFADILRNAFPYGSPAFIDKFLELAELHSNKNHDYAGGGSYFGNFERVGKILEMYPTLDISDPVVVALIYLLKQLDAALWIKNTKKETKVEGFGGRVDDIANYSIIAGIMEAQK